MKVFQFSPHELEALPKTEDNRLLFQGRTFVEDFNVSQRVYQRVIEQLRQQDDETTFCLVVEMETGYMTWREVKPSPAPMAAHVTEVISLHQPPQDTVSILPVTETSILEPDQATQVVQTELAELEQTEAISIELSTLDVPESPTVDVPSPQQPPIRKYRGVSYASPAIEAPDSPASDVPSPQQPPMRKYRGVSY